MADTARRITRTEQRDMGLLPVESNSKFVPAERRTSDLPTHRSQSWAMEITPHASQQVIVETSAVDRAKGYVITLIPLAVTLAILAVIVRIALFDQPFLAMGTLVIFWLSFAACWLAGWIVTLLLSAEGIAFYEARMKWRVIQREQAETWDYHRWQTGRD